MSDEKKDYTRGLIAGASCWLASFGMALLIANTVDKNNSTLFKYVYAYLILTSVIAICGMGLALRKHGIFEDKGIGKKKEEEPLAAVVENRI